MKIAGAIDVSCSAKEVFSWIDEPERAKQWQKAVKGGDILKETPQKIGTTFREELEENGKRLIMYGEITDYVPNKSISFQLESKIHSVKVKYSVTGHHINSTVNVESAIIWKFPMNVICFFAGQSIKKKILRQTESELAELKRLCETRS